MSRPPVPLRRHLRTALALAAPLLLLAACETAPQTGQQRADQALLDACRQRADQIFASQNRGAQYETNNSLTPYSAGPTTGLPSQGLASRYARDQMVDDCVRNLGTQTQRTITGGTGPAGTGTGGAAQPASPPPEALSLPPASATPAQLAVPPSLSGTKPAP